MRDKVFNRPDQKIKRKILRENLTLAETIVWNNIKNNKLGFSFVRQYSVEAFVLDFYCRKLKLGIEIDGEYHDSQPEYDLLRENIIQSYGIKILRFTNEEVMSEIQSVLNSIKKSFPFQGKVADAKHQTEGSIWFINYAESFYKGESDFDKSIKLKIDHTFRVVSIIRDICDHEGLSDKDMLLAETIALFHDVGRFEQLKRYNTFADVLSTDHAQLALDVCENYNLLSAFNELDACLIEYAIKHHNKLSLPTDASPSEMLYASLIRDADKVDIYKTLINHFEAWDGKEESIVTFGLTIDKKLTPEAVGIVLSGGIVEHKDMRTAYDFLLMLIGWINDLNFDRSLQLIIERGYLETLLKFLPDGEEKDKITDWVKSIIG